MKVLTSKTRRRAAALCAAGIGTAALLATGPASASSYPSLIYTQPGRPSALATCYQACGTVGAAYYPPNDTGASMFCFSDEGYYDGNYNTNQWYEIYISGKPGLWWINSSYVYYQTTVPACN